jgi:cytoskeletal protein RodZ
MTRKEMFAIGMLAAFVFASVMAVTPVAAENTNSFTDNDLVSNPNSAPTSQSSSNTATTNGEGEDTATATDEDTASTSQTNSYTDDDSQSVTQDDSEG